MGVSWKSFKRIEMPRLAIEQIALCGARLSQTKQQALKLNH